MSSPHRRTPSPRAAAAWLAAAISLGGCASVGPDYQRPQAPAPSAYREPGPWREAAPSDDAERGAWWSVFNDPVLDGLERRVLVSNQNLAAAEAAYRAAAAAADIARAGSWPTVGATAGATRAGAGGNSSHSLYSAGLDGSWTIDLWGKIRRQVESSVAEAQASAADLANARLSAQATLANDYFALRANDELGRLLSATVAADDAALTITRNQYKAGVVSMADVAQAETQVDTVRAQLIANSIQRATLEHAIAVLAGMLPEALAIAEVKTAVAVPQLPNAVPSELLERRPDIASAERAVAAANAQIGVAIAAWYPDFSLSASFAYQGGVIGTLLRTANEVWSVGPQLAQTLFDAGARNAQVIAAHASYEEAVASYRQTVLTSFQQVEDALSTLRVLGQQIAAEDQAVAAARDAMTRVINQYRAGTASMAAVITAETALLGNEQAALNARANALSESVDLIVALGGGWTAADLLRAGAVDDRAVAPPALHPRASGR